MTIWMAWQSPFPSPALQAGFKLIFLGGSSESPLRCIVIIQLESSEEGVEGSLLLYKTSRIYKNFTWLPWPPIW